MSILTLKNVSKVFNQGSVVETIALHPTDIEFERGSYTVIVGSNGSGKSTFLKLIAGDFSPTTGNILLNSNTITHLSDQKRSAQIARVFQDPADGTAPDLSLIENFRLACLRNTSKKWKLGITKEFKDEVATHLRKLAMGMENRMNDPMAAFSGGQRQAISLLMATMAPCDILLMDEPTAALDPKASERVMELANQLIYEKKLTAIMVSHNLNHALKYGSRILFFDQGKVKHDLNKALNPTLNREMLSSWFEHD